MAKFFSGIHLPVHSASAGESSLAKPLLLLHCAHNDALRCATSRLDCALRLPIARPPACCNAHRPSPRLVHPVAAFLHNSWVIAIAQRALDRPSVRASFRRSGRLHGGRLFVTAADSAPFYDRLL